MRELSSISSSRLRRQLGFTAVEISAVATIIAILALILIPIMRGRVEESKIVAAQEDMAGIEKAQMLANADTGRYYRLQDLNRPAADKDALASGNAALRARELARVPQAFWNVEALPTQISTLATTWKGPQLAVHRSVPIQQLLGTSPYLFSNGSSQGGPILFLGTNGSDDVANAADADIGVIHYPIDPWGNPYIFFGPGRVSAPDTARGLHPGLNSNPSNDTNFGSAAIYSLGPDGLPGNPANTDPTDFRSYYRDTGALGGAGSDDLVRVF